MYLSPQSLVTAAAIAAAALALLGYYNKAYAWYRRQQRQDQDIEAIMTYGVLACLKGLKERGCNGPVTEAICRIEKHINQKAHR